MYSKISEVCREINSARNNKRGPVKIYKCFGASEALVLLEIVRKSKATFVIITANQKEALLLADDLNFFCSDDHGIVDVFPSYNILPNKSVSYQSSIAAEKIRLIYKFLSGNQNRILIVSAETLVQKTIPKKDLNKYSDLIMVNEEINRNALVSKLLEGGYLRCPIVEEPGDFSVRGGIIDLFSPAYDKPVRIEFFDDIVESIKTFSVETQKKIDSLNEIILLPAREAIIEKSNIESIVQEVRKQSSIIGLPVSKIRNIVDSIKSEDGMHGIESLLPLIYPEPGTIFDYLSKEIVYVFSDPQTITQEISKFKKEAAENYEILKNNGKLCVSPDKLFVSEDEVHKKIIDSVKIEFKDYPELAETENNSDGLLTFDFSIETNNEIQNLLLNKHKTDNFLKPLVEWIAEQTDHGCKVFIVCRTSSQAERVVHLLKPYGLEIAHLGKFSELKNFSSKLNVCIGNISEGFIWREKSLAIIAEDEIFGKKKHRRKISKAKQGSHFINFNDLNTNDFVVHAVHGIGIYKGLLKLTFEGITNDFFKIVFKDDDILYLPVYAMGMIQKYVGIEGYKPVLDRMGGKSWGKIKEKAKKEVEKIAGDLLKLYSERKVKKGFRFSPTDSYFRDFEASFPFDETKDQLKAIDDVLADMESESSMDRLVCGDVGYGKTEVALRAAFKAIADGKQVAILVPTTVLAEQHYKTFVERFKNYPVIIKCLNRFRTPKTQKEIVKGLDDGNVDIVIGTHRLLSKDLAFKDLGLLIIDEEQRFGVRHKEKIKQLKTNVDVLMLSATPIPRTLHMSLTGLRDISVISTPPEERRSIITYVCEYDDSVIVEALHKEHARNGQSFFIHNNVKTIDKICGHLKGLLPELKFGIAHGQMPEKALEKIMLSFLNKEIDVLVSTTIVESGLDIQSANTMIINKADRFGLSQIYQLRGRIGRGNEQAYAFLFIPEEDGLSKNARKRLKVLMEHSDLGAGFQIAMNDLRIRGGGAALGASQSGHIAAVGYEMFLDLMEQAVSELKGEQVIEELEPEINVKLSSFFPENYIEEIDQRLMIYRRLAKVKNLREISEIKEELTDRFGKLPLEAQNILLKIMLRVLCKKAGVKRLDLTDKQLLLHISDIHQKNPSGIINLILRETPDFKFSKDNILTVNLKKSKSINGLLVQSKSILKKLLEAVGN